MMILCLCPNPAIDMYVWLRSLEPGQVNQSKKEERFPGGKGVHVALAASELGIPVSLLGFWGGPTGQWIKERCQANGITCYGPEIENWSRTCLTFKAEDRSDETELLGCGPTVSEKDFQDYVNMFEMLLPDADCVTMSGSWPQGVPDDAYAQLISKAQLIGKKVFLDCSGKQLKNALLQKPYAVHINLSEGRQLFNEVEVERIAMKLSHSCDRAAVTAGADGLYLVTEEEFVHASCKVEKVYSAVGSGDCLLAGLAVAFVEHRNIAQTAGLAVACGAANCIRPELGLLNKSDVEILQEEAILEVIKFNSDVLKWIKS